MAVLVWTQCTVTLFSWCREVDKAKYATSDVFVHYETFPDPRKVLLVSDQRILYCSKQEMLGAWTVSGLGGLW